MWNGNFLEIHCLNLKVLHSPGPNCYIIGTWLLPNDYSLKCWLCQINWFPWFLWCSRQFNLILWKFNFGDLSLFQIASCRNVNGPSVLQQGTPSLLSRKTLLAVRLQINSLSRAKSSPEMLCLNLEILFIKYS